MNDVVGTERRDRVLVVSMRREGKRNAVDRAMADALDAAFGLLDDDPDLWAGVLTGTPQIFSAGSDLRANGDYVTPRGGEYGLIRRERRKPLIAAVEGAALGGGMEMLLACDLVVAATTARFGLPEVGIGGIPACAGLFRAPQALPLNLAREMILTGEPIDARRVYAAGFVNVLSEPGRALDDAIALAERICRNAPLSVQGCLAAVNGLTRAADADGWEATKQAGALLPGSEDLAEGVRAFLEKRPPRWTGR